MTRCSRHFDLMRFSIVAHRASETKHRAHHPTVAAFRAAPADAARGAQDAGGGRRGARPSGHPAGARRNRGRPLGSLRALGRGRSGAEPAGGPDLSARQARHRPCAPPRRCCRIPRRGRLPPGKNRRTAAPSRSSSSHALAAGGVMSASRRDRGELERCLEHLSHKRWFRSHGGLIQELIPPLGHDLRLVVAGGTVVRAVKRVAPPGEWRTNVALGAVGTRSNRRQSPASLRSQPRPARRRRPRRRRPAPARPRPLRRARDQRAPSISARSTRSTRTSSRESSMRLSGA